ncbi:MAG TPA: enoyl-CoA hydratase/isomerase family protein [Thermoanaerobaculia bacterium]
MRFRVTSRGRRITVVFDDDAMNLLSTDALHELRSVVKQLATSNQQLATFSFARSAGADMNEMVKFSPDDAARFSRTGQELFATIEKLPMLTVALIDGDCFGGALDLSMSFDLRFATPRSRFAHPGARLGIVTGFGGTSRWRKIAGRPAANALMIANRTFDAAEALRVGLVDRVAGDHESELQRLEQLDAGTTQFVKTLTNSASRLTRPQLLLLAERLGALYGVR